MRRGASRSRAGGCTVVTERPPRAHPVGPSVTAKADLDACVQRRRVGADSKPETVETGEILRNLRENRRRAVRALQVLAASLRCKKRERVVGLFHDAELHR